MNDTSIAWTEATWNPVSGCTEVSPGCDHCYAKTLAERYRGHAAFPNGFDITLRPHKLREPFKLKEPSRIFVNSMSDLFHRGIPLDYVRQILDVIRACPQHQFQVLTKRPVRAFHTLLELGLFGSAMPQNMWLGVSVESQKFCSRIDTLREIPARVRFVSFEPLLERVDPDLTGIAWAIIGGESGPKARPFRPSWASPILVRCWETGCAPFVKQMGSVYAREVGATIVKNGKRQADSKGENPDFWPEILRVQEYPAEQGIDNPFGGLLPFTGGDYAEG